jgi:protein-S-isoprenylcysteine O-methyltransferase Ste14
MPSWARVATRSRVPLGFVFAAAYLWFAKPNWSALLIGFVIALIGVLIRALASGHIQKNAALATTGPYAYTRNPLYLGSIVIALGFIVAARNVWIGIATLAMFAFIYLPVIKAEEKYLRSAFADYDRYASAVPRLFPRFTRYQSGDAINGEQLEDGSQFSAALYMRHREYNAAIGSVLMLGALVIKILVQH